MAIKYLIPAAVAFISCFVYYIDFTNESPLLRKCGLQVLEYYGYKGEEHLVDSQDGLFKIKLHRIGKGESSNAVLIIPGNHCPSEILFGLGPEFDLSYRVFNSGYDTWLANHRGSHNAVAKENTTLTEDDLTNYSFHEQGVYDVSAQIDYILKITQQKSLQIIAGSIAANVAITLLASKPEYNEKITKLILLGPVGPFTELTTTFQRVVLYLLTSHKGFMDWLSQTRAHRAEVFHVLCSHPMIPFSCESFLDMYLGFNSEGIPKEIVPAALRLMFSGPWIGIYDHLWDMALKGRYVMRDYGKSKNIKVYKSETPPDYNMSNIKVPVRIYHAEADQFLTDKGRKKMMEVVPNVKSTFQVKKPFGHGNFIAGMRMDKDMVEDVIVILGQKSL